MLLLRLFGFCHWFLGGSTDSSVAESEKHCFLGDEDGEEATLGHRDAC
jgi:hypothetical protein